MIFDIEASCVPDRVRVSRLQSRVRHREERSGFGDSLSENPSLMGRDCPLTLLPGSQAVRHTTLTRASPSSNLGRATNYDY